jgi:glycosyltransferase involved in cell wall biosynthesis
MTAGAIKAAKAFDIPVVLTLTDFWFICHRHTLQRTSGQVCLNSTSLDCVRCKLEQKRRFRLPAQQWPALTNALWKGAQFVPFVHEQTAKFDERSKALRAALSEVDVAICPSVFLKQTYVSKGFKARRMHFLRQGLVNVPQSPEKTFSSHLRVGYIGQIAPHKGVHILLRAFQKVTNGSGRSLDPSMLQPHLKLYGDTTQFSRFYHQLERQFCTNGSKTIQFLGTFDNREISRIYKELDILVVPSIWYENSPNVILEAFAHRTPVIASNLGGMAELVGHQKTGLLFVPGDTDDLVRKLETVKSNPELLKELQQNIKPPPKIEAEMTELVQLYQSVLSENAVE